MFSPIRTLRRCLVLALAGWGLLASVASAEMPLVELGAGMHRIEAELAYTEPARQVGLMNRKAMPMHRGMVFVFTREAPHCMWMRNTLIPLSVAFLDREGRILNIEQMEPRTEDSHCAAAPARYALEMNRGWFAQRGIAVGDRIRGIERLPPAR
jgi:hypothetical protein